MRNLWKCGKEEVLLKCAAAFLGTYGIGYVTKIVAGTAFTNSIFTLPVAAVLFLLWQPVLKELQEITDKKPAGAELFMLLFCPFSSHCV